MQGPGRSVVAASFLAVLISAGACREPQGTSRLPLAPPAPPPTPALAAAQLLPPIPGRFGYVEEPAAVLERRGGRVSGVFGATRASLSGGVVTWAAARFATRIVAATRVANGWVFVAKDGTAARSATPLGALEPLGSLPGEVIRSLGGEGRAAVVGVDGSVWTTDGTGTIARVTGLPEGRVIRGAFADARRGAVVLDGGQALATLDGGARWVPVGPAEEAAWWVDVDRGDPMLATTRGILRLDASGGSSFEANAPGTYPPSVFPFSVARYLRVDEYRQILRSFLARDPAALGQVAIPIDSGNVMVRIESQWEVLKTASGQWAPAPDPSVNPCYLSPWGSRVGADCSVMGTGSLDAALALRGFPGLESSEHIVFSDDGRHAATRGACPGPEGSTLCVIRDGGRSVSAQQLDVGGKLVAMRGARLLVQSEEGSAAPRFRAIDVDSGVASPIRLAPDAGDGNALTSVSLVTEDLVVGVVGAGGASAARLAIGSPEQPLAMCPLPEGARHVGFRDPLHGVAAGALLSDLWTTSDGGERWERVPWPFSGAPERVRLEQSGALGIKCDAARCLVWGEVTVAIPAFSPVGPNEVLLGGRPSWPAPVARDDEIVLDEEERDSWGHFECMRTEPSLLPPPQPGNGVPRTAWHVDVAGFGVLARIYRWRGPDGGARIAVTWRGETGEGPLSGATVAGALSANRPDADESSPPKASYVLVAVDTRGLLLTRCTSEEPDGCQLLRAPAEGRVTLVPDFAMLASRPNTLGALRSLATSDGGALVLHDVLADGADGVDVPAIDILIRLGPDGRTQWRRAFAWDGRSVRVLARRDGRVGFAVSAPESRRSITFYPLEDEGPAARPVRIPDIPRGRLLPCRGPRAPGAVELLPTVGIYRFMHGAYIDGQRFHGRATLEVSPGSACTRAYEAAPEFTLGGGYYEPKNVALWSTPEGKLQGFADAGAERRRVRCAWPMPGPRP